MPRTAKAAARRSAHAAGAVHAAQGARAVGAHYLHACQDEELDSVAIRMGAAFHASLFENRPVVCYLGRRAWQGVGAVREAWKEIDAVILNGAEYEVAMGMIDSLRRHERAMELLFDGTTRERTILWNRPIARRPAAARRPTRFAKNRSVELKSARCTEPKWFMREALKRFYHAQLAWYDDALEVELGAPGRELHRRLRERQAVQRDVFRLPAETREAAVKLCRRGGSAARRRDQQLLRRIRRGRRRPRAARLRARRADLRRGRRRALHRCLKEPRADHRSRNHRLQARPQGRDHPRRRRHVILIGGKNAQGKSSTLDALTAAFGGAKQLAADPVRHGADEAAIYVELDGGKLTIDRTITADGKTKLEVRDAEGAVRRPQEMLDKLVGARFLDPLAFLRCRRRSSARS
jgi:hypothetical protein